MQNVAQAYKQTQAGTIGQGEVVVMLFDGALRFLAQAKEKMQAKDFAAKGILISKAIDVVSELDNSLNMEVGGEISKNLHQLYFMCNTRLLQANLKMDVALLDSVVAILSGLRSAFAEILQKPEAQAACASIGDKKAVKFQNTVSRPLQSHVGAGGSPHLANSMYNMQQGLTGAILPPTMTAAAPAAPVAPAAPQSEPAQPSAATMARARAALAMAGQAQQQPPAAAPQAAAKLSAPDALSKAQAALSKVQAAQSNPIIPATPPKPDSIVEPEGSSPAASVVPPQAMGGFAGKKMAMYGKLMQGQK